MNISKRIHAIAKTVRYEKVADIGTDHGYLPILLFKEKRLIKGIACDVNPLPLQKAFENVVALNASAIIETRLGSGLETLEVGEVEAVVMAGMGGMLMIELLEKGKSVAQSLTQLVLQPQQNIREVRQYLIQNDYRIDHETMIKEDGKYYFILDCSPSKVDSSFYSEKDYQFGRYLEINSSPVFHQYISREITKTERLLKTIREQQQTEDIIKRREELETYYTLCREVMTCQ